MRIFLLTGEPSGDLHGARLAQALRARDPHLEIVGVGGTRMRQAGVRLVAESEHWGAIGIAEAARSVPFLLAQLAQLAQHLRANPPDVLVLIDFGAFNVRLLRKLHGSGIHTVYYIPPGCWSRRRAAGSLPFLVDAIATPFPWSADNLRRAGAPARIAWVGHPILEYTRVTCTRDEARTRLGHPAGVPLVALVPGSRRAELARLLPVFLDTLRRSTPAPHALLTVAPSLGEAAVRQALARHGAGLEVHLLDGIDYDLVQAADAALVTSGTATLELACLNLPMVVAYRSSFATWLQYRIAARGGQLRYISLPNILADAPVVPELLQQAAHPAALAAALALLLTDTPHRRAQLQAFAALRANLGDGQACATTAALILDVATRQNAEGML